MNSLVICSAVPSNQQPRHNLMNVENGFRSEHLHQDHAQPIPGQAPVYAMDQEVVPRR